MYRALGETALQRVVKVLPDCYTQELDDCWDEDPSDWPGCPTLNQAYEENEQATEDIINALPYCSEKKQRQEIMIFAAGAAIVGLSLGLLIGYS